MAGILLPAKGGAVALESVDVTNMFVGTMLVDDVGQAWQLTVSTTALDSTHKAVNGITGLRWVAATIGLGDKRGADLTGLGAGDLAIAPGTDKAVLYVQPVGTPLTANRVLTLGVGGSPVSGHVVKVRIYDTSAFTLTVKDDAATTLFTFAASAAAGSVREAWFWFNVGTTHFSYFSTFFWLTPP